MNLAQRILEMTQESELKTVEWIFRAIEKTQSVDIWAEVTIRATSRFGASQSRDKIYATPYIKAEVIEELIGTQVYNAAMYFIYKGASRIMRTEIITDSVKKDYDSKRASLQKKIQTLAASNEITELTSVEVESDGKLGCFAILDNGDKIQIYTITAGGYNIQKFHFRGLAKRLLRK